MVSRLAKVALAAIILFSMNGLINSILMKPQVGVSDEFNHFRVHLDDGIFVLLFILVAVVFWAMFAVLPRERGYLYLGVISFLTSLLLFSDWDQKAMLFGAMPDLPYFSLAVKSGIVFIGFSLAAYLLDTSRTPLTRVLLGSSGMLWAVVILLTLASPDHSAFRLLNGVFAILVLANIAHSLWHLLSLLRSKEHQAQHRWMADGFILFLIVLLPDPGKDLLEVITGRTLGYQNVYWMQCLEDTLPWALLALITVFGLMFTRQLRTNNTALEQEVTTRERLDQLLSAMLRAYRITDLEQSLLREGKPFFEPYSFLLTKVEETTGQVHCEGADSPSSLEEDIRKALRIASLRLPSGEIIVTPTLALGAAGGTEEIKLLLTVCSPDGAAISLKERDKFALSLMSKYVSIFYEYFQLMESRLKEMQQSQAGQSPWISKLFMQIAEKERKRLASDLHDEVLQELLHIRRILERTVDEHKFMEDKELIRVGLDNAEFMIRETCRELMPPFLSDHGVLHAIDKLVEKTRLRADFQLNYHPAPVTVTLSDEHNTTIYRVVQELITNALKHSQADVVTLEVGQEEESFYIHYVDNGKGLVTGVDFSSMNRFGLRGITERIRMVGGELTVRSEPGQGVNIHCSIPVSV